MVWGLWGDGNQLVALYMPHQSSTTLAVALMLVVAVGGPEVLNVADGHAFFPRFPRALGGCVARSPPFAMSREAGVRWPNASLLRRERPPDQAVPSGGAYGGGGRGMWWMDASGNNPPWAIGNGEGRGSREGRAVALCWAVAKWE